jgi:long-subunit fatty acid transport protein
MYKSKLAVLLLLASSSMPMMAGGLLTNTNSSIAFCRNFARDGVIDIDGVYSNPAGVAFLDKGFHLSFNVQNVYQTRTIVSGIQVPSLEGTPYYQPFKLNGGDENGLKTFKGRASVPILPSFQAALNYDKWGFQLGFSLVGGGGKCTFNDGLASFERQVSLIPALLYSQGLTSDTPGYSVKSYINGQQYVFGTQFGVSYKFNEHLSVYAGFRFNYLWNKYEGNITDITANIAGTDEPLYNYFGSQAETYAQMAFYYKMRATEMTDATQKAQYEAMAAQYEAGATKLNETKEQFADRYVDCTQEGWGITPIISVDYKTGRWNFATRLEFTNHLNIENHTKRDDTGLFADGVNTPSDLPGIWTIGTQCEVLPQWRVMASWHYYFDKDAKMADNKQELLDGNTQEYLFGTEVDVVKGLTLSAGGQVTSYKLGDGAYLNDMSFVTSSYSLGFGAKFKIAKNASVNIAYFFTDYSHKKKEYDQTIVAAGQSVDVHCTDDFTRTNKVLGVGLDVDF